jgi:hypothetical protein
LMRMPCSEAEVERVFSRMRGIFGKRSRRIKRDLLEARLILQMNGPEMGSRLRAVLKGFEEQEDARPAKWQMTPPVASSPARPGFPVPMIFRPAPVVPGGRVAPPGWSSAALMPWSGGEGGEPIASWLPK